MNKTYPIELWKYAHMLKSFSFQLDESKAGRHPTQFIIFWYQQVILIRINKKTIFPFCLYTCQQRYQPQKQIHKTKHMIDYHSKFHILTSNLVQTALQSFKLFFRAKTKTQKVKIINKKQTSKLQVQGAKQWIDSNSKCNILTNTSVQPTPYKVPNFNKFLQQQELTVRFQTLPNFHHI
jgi:hypothetical protein